MVRSKSDYALLWANGMTFGEVYDLMKADIKVEVQIATLEWARAQDKAKHPLRDVGGGCVRNGVRYNCPTDCDRCMEAHRGQ